MATDNEYFHSHPPLDVTTLGMMHPGLLVMTTNEDWTRLISYEPICEPGTELQFTTMNAALGRLKEEPGVPVRVRPKGSPLSLKLGVSKRLDGESEVRVLAVGDGSIVKLFDKTAFPTEAHHVVCPHFTELKWAYGCPYNCAWCYLKGTLRFLSTKARPVTKDAEKTRSHVEFFLDEWKKRPELLNTGEICDSLMSEKSKDPLSLELHPLFKGSKHKLLFLTKSNWVDNLLNNGFHDEVIMSFSLNAEDVAYRWEKGAPPVKERIEAASKVSERGYTTRIRIDPMVPIKKWANAYIPLVDMIFDKLRPERITLGSLRGLQSTINSVSDKSWTEYLSDRSNWGLRVDNKKRLAMYKSLMKYLRKEYDYESVALCKETTEVWDELGMDYRKIRCNCVL